MRHLSWWVFGIIEIAIVVQVCVRSAHGALGSVDLALGCAFGVLMDELVRGSNSDGIDDRD